MFPGLTQETYVELTHPDGRSQGTDYTQVGLADYGTLEWSMMDGCLQSASRPPRRGKPSNSRSPRSCRLQRCLSFSSTGIPIYSCAARSVIGASFRRL